ncbi:MAG TPA: protein kinase [Pirellulales bacterium]|nr:protein kinase [Pirellulales bacterium]
MSIAAAYWVGTTLSGGRYRIIAKLGEGGMGVVYRAWDENIANDVVVKAPRRSMMDDPGFAARFKGEMRSLIDLPHPHIVKLSDMGEHDGLPFAVMQFLPGGSLEDRAYDREGKPRPMPVSSLSGWLPHVAKALQFMHGKNFIHRDVKPGNILFDAQGNAYLSDFGAYKALAGGEAAAKAHTGTGMVLGTPHYMAPELARGEEVDGRIDQYALAVTVYEVLSGQKPFDGPNGLAIMFQHVNQAAPPLDSVAPGIPRVLAEAVLRGMDKDPGNRFKSCTAFAGAALAGLSGATAPPRPAGGTAAFTPIPVSGAAAGPKPAPVPLPVSSPNKGTQQTLRPAVKTAVMAAAPVPLAPAPAAPIPVAAGERPPPATRTRRSRQKNPALDWLKSPVGISVSVAGGLVLVVVLGIVMSSGDKAGKPVPPKPPKIVNDPVKPKPDPDRSTTPVVTDSYDPGAEANLKKAISDWNALANEIEAELPLPPASLVNARTYNSLADLQTAADKADGQRNSLGSDWRIDKLENTAVKFEDDLASLQNVSIKSQTAEDALKVLARDVAALKNRMAKIKDQLSTSIAQSPEVQAKLASLRESERKKNGNGNDPVPPPPPRPDYTPPGPTTQWVASISLPGGGSLAPGDLNLNDVQLTKYDKGMSPKAYAFKNEKSPKGGLLVHASFSANTGQSLNLDGWTICRYENGSPKLVAQFEENDRSGPLRYWESNKLRLYAEYKNDKLHGLACYLNNNGAPLVALNYSGNRLRNKYLVDYKNGTPQAVAVDGTDAGLDQQFAGYAQQFQDMAADIKQKEIEFKAALRDAYEKLQKQAVAQQNKTRRQRDKLNEAKARAANNAAAARTISAIAIGTGAGF